MIDIKDYKAKAFDELVNAFTKENGSVFELFSVLYNHIEAVRIMEELELKERINKEYKMDKGMDW